MQFKSKVAFSLMEIMLVVIIIGLLAALAAPRLVGKSKEARIAVARSDVNSNIPTALDFFELDNGQFPSTDQGIDGLIRKPSTSPMPTNWNGPYLKKLPKDPWNEEYVYLSPGNHNTADYDLFSKGPDKTEGTSDDIGNW